MTTPIPVPGNLAQRKALRALWKNRTILAALEVFRDEVGDIFQLSLPGFHTVFMAGPEAVRWVLVGERDHLCWRSDPDPVTRLLRHGVLVEDGDTHDTLRRTMQPALHRQTVERYANAMIRHTDAVTQHWRAGHPVDMFVEMRKIALLIVADTLFGTDFSPDMQRLWQPVLKSIQYISPGLWILWPGAPRPGFRRALQRLDAYLYGLIEQRRALGTPSDDLIGLLSAADMSDDWIRDQLLTMLIAGHDTSTALLAWTLVLLATHPAVWARARQEVDQITGSGPLDAGHAKSLRYLGQVINESLRLYPPIHLGSRIAARDLTFQDYRIPAGTRVMYSIYLTHRHPAYWPEPARFDPERFSPDNAREHAHYTFLPFGGGPRNCMGMAFAQLEAKLVLARIIQCFDLRFVGKPVRVSMKATLEPHHGVMVEAVPR